MNEKNEGSTKLCGSHLFNSEKFSLNCCLLKQDEASKSVDGERSIIRHRARLNAEMIQPVSMHMPQWSNYKSTSSGINPADSTLRLAIWQGILLAQIRGCEEMADPVGEHCKDIVT